MAVNAHRPRRRIDPALVLMPGIVAVGLVTLLVRLWFLQVVRGEELSLVAERRTVLTAPVIAPRGQILDRQGRLLAGVKPTLVVMVRPVDLKDKDEAIQRLANIIQIDTEDIKTAVANNRYRGSLPFVIKSDVTPSEAIAIEEQKAFLPGVSVRQTTVRYYPFKEAGAHAVGYVGGLDEADQKRLKEAEIEDLPNFIGKVGIERSFDIELIGTAGTVKVQVDRRGRQLSEVETAPPIPGDKLVLGLDLDLQVAARSALGGRRGSVVAIDPSTGQILCMVSSPDYDPNLFAGRITSAQMNSLLNNPAKPFLNRAVAAAYAPGSTFKIAVLIAAVRAGIVSPGTTHVCEGSARIFDRTFRCLGTHGRINYETAMEKSCNVFFAEVAKRLTYQQIAEVAMEFGLGKRTGIDLVSERRGLVPTEQYLKDRNIRWYLGDTVNLGIGQGYLEATPLQMANFAAIIANRGYSFKPHIVQNFSKFGENEKPKYVKPEMQYTVQVDPLWWDRIVGSMQRVVATGTGASARIEGISFAGKTGSADTRQTQRAHAWFIGFAPVEKPRIAIAVVLEAAGRGGEEAAPVARSVVSRYLKTAQ